MELAERVNIPVDELTDLLATLEAQPIEARERFLRGFLEAWLMQQREAYEAEQHGGDDGSRAGWPTDSPSSERGPRPRFPTERPPGYNPQWRGDVSIPPREVGACGAVGPGMWMRPPRQKRASVTANRGAVG